MSKPIQVLYIEDDPNSVEIVRLMLEEGDGYYRWKVDSANSVQQASEMLRGKGSNYHLLLLDLGLPDWDVEKDEQGRPLLLTGTAHALIEAISVASRPSGSREVGLPIIIVSGQTPDSSKSLLNKAGNLLDYVQKPIPSTFRELVEVNYQAHLVASHVIRSLATELDEETRAYSSIENMTGMSSSALSRLATTLSLFSLFDAIRLALFWGVPIDIDKILQIENLQLQADGDADSSDNSPPRPGREEEAELLSLYEATNLSGRRAVVQFLKSTAS